jgi:hypothetical protein
MAALCRGTQAGRYCYTKAMPWLDAVDGFWDRYLAVGRCALDPDHVEHFVGGDRFAVEGDTRRCLWYGAQHCRTLLPRTVLDETWTAL